MPWLEWLDRKKDLDRAQHIPYRLLEHVPDLSFGDAEAGNMLIQGDNLDALKALLPYFAGQVKCIFIDPPYNTQSAFGEFYDDNLEHAKWLSMIYPRLELLRRFLREDGSLWITLDDNEAHYCKVVADEIFGRKNFVSSFAWEKDQGRRGDTDVSSAHDHILAYAKSRETWRKTRNLLPRTEKHNARYRNPDNDPRGPWLQGDNGTAKSGSEKSRFPIQLPSGRWVQPPKGNYWRFSPENFDKARAEGRVYFGADGDRLPIIKRYLSEVQDGVVPRTWWPAEDAGTNQSAKRDHLRKLLPDIEPFPTPKPEELMRLIFAIASNEGDIVMDSFLGSGTAAAAAMKMKRRWIGIESNDHATTHAHPRLVKVIEGEQGGISQAVDWNGGGGFQFYKLGPAVFDEHGRIREDVRFKHLAAHLWFAETGRSRPNLLARSPLLGVHDETAYYLLFNGILGDRRPDSGNVLTTPLLNALPALPEGAKRRVIFGEATRISPERLRALNIQFKQIPYDIHAR